ncbi:MAG: N-formylglutamate amidohydrolase [Geminicoccaceae bacterium]
MYDPEPEFHDRVEIAFENKRFEETGDVEAVEIFNHQGQAPVLILSDHSGRRIPSYLGDLGLSEDERKRHIGWDIGAADMTRRLAVQLDAPAVLNHISRLVIDPNRHPGTATSVPTIADGTVIPGNEDIDDEELNRRIRLSFIPYHRAISQQIARLRRRIGTPVIISMHSFTPAMQRAWRPWDVGVLWAEDDRLAKPVLESLRDDETLCVGDNQPYSGDHPESYSLLFHAKRPGFPNVAFEVRQDLIDTRERAEAWADRLSKVLQPALSDPTLYRSWGSWRRLVDADCAAVADARSGRRIPAG